MYNFNVTYTLDNYFEYYKFTLVRQRIYKDLIFCVLFIAFGIYYIIANKDVEGFSYLLPILAFALGIMFPCLNFVTLPLLKKQLRARQTEIDRTHINVTFNDDEVVYENLTVKPEAPVDETMSKEDNKEEAPVEETKKEEVVENQEVAEESKAGQKDEKTFILKYNNFMLARETAGLFMFYLDRQTVIILPKEKFTNGSDFTNFKAFIRSKMNPKFVKFLKEKNLEK